VFFQDDDGTAPVAMWLAELRRVEPRAFAKCVIRLERLGEMGHELRRPEADILRDGIHGLRMSTRKTKKVSGDADALRMLEPLSHDDPAMREMLAEERSNAALARQIYELRTAKGLTQQQLAELIGTKQPVIARLEDADYQGHSLAMLYRIGAALGCGVAVGFVPRSAGKRSKPRQAPMRSPAERTRAKAR